MLAHGKAREGESTFRNAIENGADPQKSAGCSDISCIVQAATASRGSQQSTCWIWPLPVLIARSRPFCTKVLRGTCHDQPKRICQARQHSNFFNVAGG